MQQKVPQDVQREDTIIGPLTLRQMIILGVGGGIAYSIYVSLAKKYFIEVWLGPVAIVSILTLAFAFLKIHNQAFHQFLMNLIQYTIIPRKRYWIQGSGRPFLSPFQSLIYIKKSEKKENKKTKDFTKLTELSKIVDSYGKADILKK